MQAKDFKYNGHRNSYTELNEVYFWTITINNWHQFRFRGRCPHRPDMKLIYLTIKNASKRF